MDGRNPYVPNGFGGGSEESAREFQHGLPPWEYLHAAGSAASRRIARDQGRRNLAEECDSRQRGRTKGRESVHTPYRSQPDRTDIARCVDASSYRLFWRIVSCARVERRTAAVSLW